MSGQLFGYIISGVVILIGVLLLAVIIRSSLASGGRSHDWKERLRQPQIDDVAANWKVNLPTVLETFYREAEFIDREMYYLTRSHSSRDEKWFVSGFIPLTPLDLKEWIKITRVPGLPLATGGENGKSIYYLPFEQLHADPPTRVMMRPDGMPPVQVAASIEDFVRFVAVYESEEKK